MKCEEVTRLISESLDRELPLRKRIGVWLHFLVCRCCARYRQNLRLIKKVMRIRRDQPEEPGAEERGATLSPEARERIKTKLRS